MRSVFSHPSPVMGFGGLQHEREPTAHEQDGIPRHVTRWRWSLVLLDLCSDLVGFSVTFRTAAVLSALPLAVRM